MQGNTTVIGPRQHILTEAVPKESLFDLKSTFSFSDLCKWFVLVTNRSCDENDKFLPILNRRFVTNGLVTISLIDILDIDKESD